MKVEHRAVQNGRGTVYSRDTFWLDAVLWVALCCLAMALPYHPYFFGDEMSPLRDASVASSFREALTTISLYKPRLVFNAIWAYGGVHEWPRWAFGAVNAIALMAIGGLSAGLAREWFSATRTQIWLLLACILLSRYSAMIYFDYVSGIIETLSFAFLLGAISLAYRAVFSNTTLPAVAAVVCAIAAVLVHERYIAGAFALGCVIALAPIVEPELRTRWRVWVLAPVIAVLPAVIFLSLVRLMKSLPVSTGTSGQEIILNAGTLKVFFSYIGNAFLGLNFGRPWFVGELTMDTRRGLLLGICAAICFAFVWAKFVQGLRSDRRAARAALALVMVIGAMIVMASLPGEGRQEARWMYPVGTLVCLLALASPIQWVRYALLSLTLALACVHWASGALEYTANVYVSRTARNLGEGINKLTPPGRHALLLGLGHDPWDVGHRSGVKAFAARNFTVPVELRIFDPAGGQEQRSWADLLILRSVVEKNQVAHFTVVNGDVMDMILEPKRIDAVRRLVRVDTVLGGGQAGWLDWSWSQSEISPAGTVFIGGPDARTGFRGWPAARLAGETLVYRARTQEGGRGPAKMRLQVNWMTADGRFLNASINVANVSSDWKDYSMALNVPENAETGLVYASVHDGEDAKVELAEVRLEFHTVHTLGANNEWDGWQWQGDPQITPAGVVLSQSDRVVGFRELPVDEVDNRLLVYRARLLNPGPPSEMRLQVNWMDRDGKFIGASIDAVPIDVESANHALFVVAPAAASSALVYANLHDGERTPVLLESVDLVNAKQQ